MASTVAPADTRGCDHRVLLGVDLVMVADIAASISEFGDRYLRRVFTRAEQATCLTVAGEPDATRLAARFAAKEATIKALGLISETVLTDIEVLTDDDGRPELRLQGRYHQQAAMFGATNIALSMSHDGPYAMASVVILAHRDTPYDEAEENRRAS